MSAERYLPFISFVLTPQRLAHALGVMRVMGELAEIYDLDPATARTTGLLLDAAKARWLWARSEPGLMRLFRPQSESQPTHRRLEEPASEVQTMCRRLDVIFSSDDEGVII